MGSSRQEGGAFLTLLRVFAILNPRRDSSRFGTGSPSLRKEARHEPANDF